MSKASSGAVWIPKEEKSESNTNAQFFARKAAVFSAMTALSNVGIAVQSPLPDAKPLKMLQWLDVQDEKLMTESNSKSLALSVSGSGVNDYLVGNNKSSPQLRKEDMDNAAMVSKFLNIMTNKFPSNSLSQSTMNTILPTLSMVVKYAEDKVDYSKEQKEKEKPVPPQFERAAFLGRSAPGVLSGGRFSQFVQGMVMSVEVKSSTKTAFMNSNLKEVLDVGTLAHQSGYRNIRMPEIKSRVSNRSGRLSQQKRYRICRLVPYRNDILGVGDNNIRSSTTIFDEYFLVEVG